MADTLTEMTNISKDISTSGIEDVERRTDVVETTNITKIFLYAANTYHGRAIVRELKQQKDESLEQTHIEPSEASSVDKAPSFSVREESQIKYQITSCLDPILSCSVDDPLPIDYFIDQGSSVFEQTILDQDILIYDTNFDVKGVNDALEMVKILEKWAVSNDDALVKKKRLILISNLMTWAMTDAMEKPFSDKDYRKRRPHPCYRRYLRLEQEVTNLQAKYKDKFETLIICPGITFGYEEDILQYLFKMALFNKQDIEIFEPGNNDLPLINVTDLAKLVRNVIESFPSDKKYLLGFNPAIKYQKFVLEIAKLITGLDDVRLKVCPKERMLLIDHHLLTQRSYDKLTLNLNMAASNFVGFEFEQDLEKIVQRTVQEYYETRSIKPVKILIHGPPSCGKTTLAKALACYYASHYIIPDEILEDAVIRLEKKVKQSQEHAGSMTKYVTLLKNDVFKEMLDKTEEKLGKWDEEIKITQQVLNSNNEESIKKLKEKYSGT